jgi:hypothetical protein
VAVFRKRTTETNTLVLIHEWSMDGARGDLDGRFGSPVDIHAVVAERRDEPAEGSPPAPPPLMLKPAGEDEWRPFLVGVQGTT